MKITILGGGIGAISLAFFLQRIKKIKEINILEKEDYFGGLLKTYNFNKIDYDVGPHVIFSKHADILSLILKLLGKNKIKIRRSNKIIYKNLNYIKYPFENDLSNLPKKDRDKCLNLFINNPFKNIVKPKTMKEFFLKTFGKGIYDSYLGPYNAKIWKMRPSNLDTQMVDRIPQPPVEDIIRSANGTVTEGYKHQLYFYYPFKGGIESLFNSFLKKLDKNKVKLIKNCEIKHIKRINKNSYELISKNIKIKTNKIISTIPLDKFYRCFEKKNLKKYSSKLKSNSIIISIINIKGNVGGDNFALMVPDKDIIFHRFSKLDFLGKNYSLPNTTSLEIEITFRSGDKISKMNDSQIYKEIIKGLKKLKFIKNDKDINFKTLKKFKYAYVIYDLKHRKNVDKLIKEYLKLGIHLLGRWGSWEYLNSDQVIKQAKDLSQKI